jgi:hypothetical protein
MKWHYEDVSCCMTNRVGTLRTDVAKKSTSRIFSLLLSFILSAKSFFDMSLGVNTVNADFTAHFGCRVHVVFLAHLKREEKPTCGRRRRNDPSGDTTKHVDFWGGEVSSKQVVNKEHTLAFHRALVSTEPWSRPGSTAIVSKMAVEERLSRMDAIRVAKVCSDSPVKRAWSWYISLICSSTGRRCSML